MRRRVLVLDEGFMSGAYAAIGLRDAGWRVTVLAATGGRGDYRGRDISWSLAPAVSSASFLSACDRTVQHERPDVVYPVTEPIQRLVWSAEPSWSDRTLPNTEPWQRELFRDKAKLGCFLSARGVAVPASHVACGEQDVRDAVAALGTPIVVKGVDGRGGTATWIAASLAEAVLAFRRAHALGTRCFVQHYIRGSTYLVGGVFRDGEPVRVYAGEKLGQYPPRTGPAFRMRSVDDPALLEIALRVFAATRVSALASLDIIRDDDGREGSPGQYLFLELNPRPWGSIAAAAEAGVDLFSPLATLLAGERPAPDVGFRANIESTVFPLYLRAPEFWRGGRVIRTLTRDLRGVAGAPWREPGQALHLANRIHRVARNWPR